MVKATKVIAKPTKAVAAKPTKAVPAKSAVQATKPTKAAPVQQNKAVARDAPKKKVAPIKKAKPVIKRQGTMSLVAQEAQDFLTWTEDAFNKRREERQKLQKHADAILYPKKYKKVAAAPKTKPIKKLPKTPVRNAIVAKSSSPKTNPAKHTTPVVAPSPKPVVPNKKAAIAAAAATINTKKPVVNKKAAPKTADTNKALPPKVHKIEKKDKKDKPSKSPKPVAPTTASTKKSATKVSASPAPIAAASPEPPKAVAQKKKIVRQESKLIESGLATGMIDVVFCIDTTGSMDSYLEETKTTVNSIVEKVKEQSKGESVSVRFGVVAYRDHPPQETTYLTKTLDLSQDKEVLDFLEQLDCTGGGDGAEAVFDGLLEAAKSTSWRDSKSLPSLRYIFHITDAPPHGDQYQGYSELWGSTGCPCGTDVNKVAHVINIEQIHYRLVKIGSKLTKMAEQFKEKFVNYEECPIDSAAGMDIKITDMIIRELVPDMAFD